MTRLNPKLLHPSLVFLVVCLTHSPALLGGFVWDDTQYILHNPTLSDTRGLFRIWFEPRASPQYYPLTFTTFWLERRLFGSNPFGYHFTNLLLHSLGSVLLWLLLSRVGAPHPGLVAGLWGIHPMKVESVAWISERKDVLSGVLALLSLLAWEAFRRNGRSRDHGASILLFAGALLAKTAVAPLPLVLLVWAYWEKGRLERRDWILAGPFFGLSLAAGLGHVLLEQTNIDVAGAAVEFSGQDRLYIAGRAFWFYVGKFFWPHPLMPIYPRWPLNPGNFLGFLIPFSVLLLTAASWVLRGKLGRGPICAQLIFLLMLSPALGFISQAFNRYSFVADHFQYLASAGLAVLLGGALQAGVDRYRLPRHVLFGISLAVAIPLLATAGSHAFRFKDDRILFTHNLAYNPNSWGVHTALGAVALREGNGQAAVDHFRRARELEPNSAQACYNLGAALALLGQPAAAVESYGEALRLAPDYAEAHNNLALILHQMGRDEEALHHLSKAIEAKPGDSRFAANRETILRKMKRR